MPAAGFGQIPKDLPALSAVQRELKGGETHSYKVQLIAGQFLHARVEQENIDVVTAVFGPDGKQLTESDSPNDRFGPEPILLVASASGEYRVDVRSASSSAPAGRYHVEIVALREASETDKAHAAAQLAFDEGKKLRTQQTVPARRGAIEKYKNALSLFHTAGDPYRQALSLLSIGITHYQLNEIRKALEYFNETLTMASSIRNPRLEAATESFVGGMLDVLGDVHKALDHHHRALKLARENTFRMSEGIALSNIGKIYSDVADWQKALEFYSQALTVFRSISSAPNEALTVNNIGIAYYELGELQKALEYLQQALPLLRAAGNRVPRLILSSISPGCTDVQVSFKRH